MWHINHSCSHPPDSSMPSSPQLTGIGASADAIVEPRERAPATTESSSMESRPQSHLLPVPSPFPSKVTDAELVSSVVEGSKLALRVVWDRYLAQVRATLRSLLGADPVIDDLAQEVFLTFYRSAGRIRDPGALRSYLLGVATRLACFEIRTRARRNRWYRLFHRSALERGGGLAPDVDDRDTLRALRELLGKLPDRERQAFVLRYVQDLSPTEVAQAMGIPKGTAKRAISEGRRRLLLRAQKEPDLRQYLRSSQERLR
jgi:RNA polymerase sigma-70 factor, ECF subfamily